MDSLIVCPEPRAAKVGRDVLAQGGNAVDAAVAAAFAQAVVNPLQCGIGGTALIYYYDARNHRRLALNAEAAIGSRPVPKCWAEEYAGQSGATGRHVIRSEANQLGYQSIMTPGFVRGCWTAFRRFGSRRISWSDLLAPAHRLAVEGFEVYPYIAAMWQKLKGKPGYPGLLAKLRITPDAARAYLKPDGSIYEEGDRLLQPDLARTIRRLADAGGDDFYTGEIGLAISQDLARHGAFTTPEDLQDYDVDQDRPLCGAYRGLEVTAPPFSFGAQFIGMLQVAEHFDLAGLRHNTPEYVDTLARIQRASFAGSARLEGMSREEARPLERELISYERAVAWAGRIKGGDRIAISGAAAHHGTTHLTCIDADRNVVSFTHSIGSLAGSGVVTPGLGFLYNNFLGFFRPSAGSPDSIVPGKKIGGSMAAIIFKDGEPYIALGSPSSKSSTAAAQCVMNVVDHGMDMRTAVSVARFHSEAQQLITVEPQFSERSVQALREMGNEVQRSTDMGRVQAILARPDTHELEAGPDPRGGAGAGRHP